MDSLSVNFPTEMNRLFSGVKSRYDKVVFLLLSRWVKRDFKWNKESRKKTVMLLFDNEKSN